MATAVQLRRGTTTQNNAFTGALGEVSVDTTLDTIRVHDASTAGGFEITSNAAVQTLTNKTITSPVFVGGLNTTPVTLVATGALTAAAHAGRTLFLGEVGGNAAATFTMPDATGSGNIYEFIVTVANTSNYKIQAPDANNVFTGQITYLDEDGTAVTAYPTVAASDTITLNAGTTGGIVGDSIRMIDILADKWAVMGQMRVASGTNPATPFSAAVS
jgi:hypothetical protein